MKVFTDRRDAGKILSHELGKFKNEDAIILAVPRGGLVTSYDSIKKYDFPWDLIISRKIGAPRNKEVAIGAVSADGSYFTNEKYVKLLGISQSYIDKQVSSETREIKRRLKQYRGSEAFPDVKNKTVIIVDDGIATGFTILASIKSVKNQGASKTVLAVPVGPLETIEEFKGIVDEVICPYVPEEFYAVGEYYEDFDQVSDEEVFDIIKELKN
ncbi:MAG TPA: phosphoribosyltransferase family protein [Clostridia bacterium]